MARQSGDKVTNTFIRGIITEASALTYPENASLDEENFILNHNGSRQRRLGIDYENLHKEVSSLVGGSTFVGFSLSTFKWDNVGHNSSLSIGVVQTGPRLFFVDLTRESLSDNVLNSGLPIDVAAGGDKIFQYAAIDGKLIVMTEQRDPLLFEYIEDEDSFLIGTIDIKIRDLIGIDDSISIDETPINLSPTHKYNLLNQGWDDDKMNQHFSFRGDYPANTMVWHAGKDALGEFKMFSLQQIDFGTSPAPRGRHVIDAFDRGASRLTQGNILVNTSSVEGFYEEERDGLIFGSKTLDLGDTNTVDHIVYINEKLADSSQYSIDTSGATDVVTFDVELHPLGNRIERRFKVVFSIKTSSSLQMRADKELGFLRSAATHAGRVFYAGINSTVVGPDVKSPDYTGWIFFSRTVTEPAHLGQCYQEADPTAEEISDLVDSDGGTIPITGAANILKLVSIGDELMVFAENGVWEIVGTDKGFLATDYSLHKITSIGAINADSIVAVEDNVYYWSEGGIYALAPDNITGRYSATNISETTIQTLLNNVPGIAKGNVAGVYDTANKRISWLYNDSDDYDGITDRHQYNKELIFDTVLSAFYKNSISESTPYIAGYMQTPNFLTVDDIQAVVVDGEQVQASLVDVAVTTTTRSRGFSTVKYLTIIPDSPVYKFTFSQYKNEAFVDWQEFDSVGVDYSSFLITGQELYGDPTKKKGVPYILFYFNRTEDGFTGTGMQLDLNRQSSCMVQSRWSWANSANSGQWGSTFQAYRLRRNYIPDALNDPFDYGYDTIVTKNKLRGYGRSLSLNIHSESGKDMHLLGWGVSVSGGNVI